MKNKPESECKAIAQEHLDKYSRLLTCRLGARNRDKVLKHLRALILKQLKRRKSDNG